MDPLTANLLNITTRARPATPSRPQPVEAHIVTATTTTATVDQPIPGPIPLPAGLAAAPEPGTRCLIVFSAQGNPWIVAVTTVAAQ